MRLSHTDRRLTGLVHSIASAASRRRCRRTGQPTHEVCSCVGWYHIPIAAGLALALSGCLPAAIPGAVMGAATLYCAGVSDAGKVLARDALTRGAPLIACPDTWAAGTPPAAPGGAPEAGP